MEMLRKDRQKGFTLIELLIVIAVIAILAAIAIPNLLSSKKGANEGNAISTLKSMVNAEETFKSRNLGGDNQYGTLQEMMDQKVITFGDPTNKINSGYQFSDVVADATSFLIKAVPVTAGSTGDRYFAVTEDGFVRESTAAMAEVTSAAVQAAYSVVGG